MASCRNCGTKTGESYNFCPTCATPQTDEADRRLEAFIDKRAKQRHSGGKSGLDDIRTRLQYALGYVAIVAGLTTLTAGSGPFFLLAGLVLLPPVRTAVESRLDLSLGDRPTAVAAGVLTVVGAATFVFV